MLSHTFMDRDGPTLLLIHGLGSDRHCFDAAIVASQLKQTSLLIPDLPGFGESQVDKGYSYHIEEAADHLVSLCERYRIKSCSIVGHSMGGAIGVLFAERFGVTHFINAVGNLVPEDTLFSRKIAEQDFATFSALGFRTYKEEIRKSLRGDRPLSSYPAALEKTTARAMYLSSQNLVHLSDKGNLLERFIKLTCKKAYLQDEDNPIARHLEQRLSETMIAKRVVPDTGHGIMEDNPGEFYQFVGDFLKQ